MGIDEPSPRVMEGNGKGVQEKRKLLDAYIFLEAPKSKIQSVPEFPWAAKLFTAWR